MPNPLWLGSGGCPVVTPKATVTPLFCTFQGFYPFVIGTAAPTLYAQFKCTLNTNITVTVTPTPPGGGGAFPQTETSVLATLTTAAKDETTPDTQRAITNASMTPGSDSTFNITLGGVYPSRTPPSDDRRSAYGVNEGDQVDPTGVVLYGFYFTAHFASATLFELSTTHQVNPTVVVGRSATIELNAATMSVELVTPDTAADAIARAAAGADTLDVDGTGADDFGFGGGLFSLIEARPDGDWVTFGARVGTYQLDCAGLAPGVLYRYVVVWEQREAVGIGTGDESAYGTTWTNSDSQSDTFRPEDTTFATEAIAIPAAAGKQKRIKSINLTAIGG